MTDRQPSGTPDQRSFPGGRAKLPIIDPRLRSAEPEMAIVGTAFVRTSEPAVPEAPPVAEAAGTFAGYFTYESLFEDPAAAPDGIGHEDPYRVLRLRRTCTWEQAVAAHRHLVKEFHPDRFVGEDPDVVAQAEAEIRRVNLAFDALKAVHPDAP